MQAFIKNIFHATAFTLCVTKHKKVKQLPLQLLAHHLALMLEIVNSFLIINNVLLELIQLLGMALAHALELGFLVLALASQLPLLLGV